MLKRIRADFSRRDEFDRMPAPPGLSRGEAVILFDEDMEVRASLGRGRMSRFLQIHWGSVRFASFKDPPPDPIRKQYEENPALSRRAWPT